MSQRSKIVKALLDLGQEARLARAAEQGFDTATPLYHGTSKDVDFQKFKDSRHGTWTTTDPKEASGYALQNDSKGFRMVPVKGNPWNMEPVNSAARVIPLYGRPLQNPYVLTESGLPDFVAGASNYKKAQSDWFDQLRAAGHDGVIMPGNVRVDFDNSNLRGMFSPFDPASTGKKIIGGAAGATIGLGALADPSQYEMPQ